MRRCRDGVGDSLRWEGATVSFLRTLAAGKTLHGVVRGESET